MGTLKTSLKGKIEILGHEGIALTKYLDSVGVWTIGGGATRSEIPDLASWPNDKKLSIKEVLELFDQSLEKYELAVNRNIKVVLTQEQYDALVSICYNIGTGGLAGSTFVRRINIGAKIGALPAQFLQTPLELNLEGRTDPGVKFTEQVSLSIGGGGTIVEAIMFWTKPKEITGRRKKEALLFSTGKYSNRGKVLVFPVNPTNHHPQYSKGYEINAEEYLTEDDM